MNLQPCRDSVGFGRLKSFVQRCGAVNIQIVHHQYDLFTVTVIMIHQFPQKMSKIHRSTAFCNLHNPFAGQRFKRHKQIHYSVTAILIIHTFRLARFHRQTPLFNQLTVGLIQTYYRTERIVRTFIHIQYILHLRYEFCSGFRDAPFFFLPGFKFVFFRVFITAVSDMLSTTPRRTSSSAIICNVQ